MRILFPVFLLFFLWIGCTSNTTPKAVAGKYDIHTYFRYVAGADTYLAELQSFERKKGNQPTPFEFEGNEILFNGQQMKASTLSDAKFTFRDSGNLMENVRFEIKGIMRYETKSQSVQIDQLQIGPNQITIQLSSTIPSDKTLVLLFVDANNNNFTKELEGPLAQEFTVPNEFKDRDLSYPIELTGILKGLKETKQGSITIHSVEEYYTSTKKIEGSE